MVITAFKVPGDDLRNKPRPGGRDTLVDVHHSISYNGGTVVGDKWYSGFEVGEPILPDGYELVGTGEGSQLNAHPPYVRMILRKKQ